MRAPLPQDDLDLVLSLTPEFWSRFGGARLFITGGTGFIGAWLLQVLQHANDRLGSRIELVVLTRDPERARQQAPHVLSRPDTSLLAGDVSTFAGPVGTLDFCIHAATDVGNPFKAGDPLKVFDSIVLGTRRVLDLALANGASRFLLTSSGAVYGSQPASLERVAETYVGAPDPLQPGAAYGNGKRAAEWLAAAYAAQALQAGFEPCIARIFALIGPGLPLNGPFAAGNFVRDALAGQAINVQGDGRPLRSYLYMADLCVWLLRILASGASGQAYNVGSENAVSIAALARKIVDAAGTNTPIEIQTAAASDAPAPRYVPDTLKARHGLGLAEYTPLKTALLKTIHWSRSATAQ
jgi:nucleoside-diphosphate-sugar epimerase